MFDVVTYFLGFKVRVERKKEREIERKRGSRKTDENKTSLK